MESTYWVFNLIPSHALLTLNLAALSWVSKYKSVHLNTKTTKRYSKPLALFKLNTVAYNSKHQRGQWTVT